MEIGKTSIVRQISNNISLFTGREGIKTTIPPVISPVAEITQQGKYDLIYFTDSISGTGAFAGFIIPSNEYWTIKLATTQAISGTWTMNSIFARLPDYRNCDTNESSDADKWTYGQTNVVYLLYDATGGKTFLSFDGNYKDVRLPPETQLGIQCDGYTSTGTMGFKAIVAREIY